MSKRRYHRRSKMKRRGVKNGSQHGSNMAPKWLQNGSKMAPWRPLGGPWARPCCQTLPGAVPERLWHGPGRPKKFILAALERPWSEKWIDFASWKVPGRVPEGVWEVIWGAFWRYNWRDLKQGTQSAPKNTFFNFLHAFSHHFCVCSVRLDARRRESQT